MNDEMDLEKADVPAPTDEQVESFDVAKARPLLWEIWCACQLLRQMGFSPDDIYAIFAHRVKHKDDDTEHADHACVILHKPPYPDFTLIIGPFIDGDQEDWPMFVEAVARKADDTLLAKKFWSSWARANAAAIISAIHSHGIQIPKGDA